MVEYQSTPDFYNEYISHHGILGQKWGKQNGPPYPLGSDVSTGSRLKSGAKGSVKKKSYKNRSDNLSEVNLKRKESSKEEIQDKKHQSDDIKEWLSDLYLEDNFDGWYDGDNPLTGSEGIDDWGADDLIEEAKNHIENHNKVLLTDEDVKQALIDSWNEHYGLPTENKQEIKEIANNAKINDDNDFLDTKIKDGNHDFSVYGFKEHTNESDIKKVAESVMTNRSKIKKLALEAIKEDPYIYKDFAEPLGISKEEFEKMLDIRSVYTTGDGVIEISMYPKNSSVLGGHSLDMEFYLNNLKKPPWVAVNG